MNRELTSISTYLTRVNEEFVVSGEPRVYVQGYRVRAGLQGTYRATEKELTVRAGRFALLSNLSK